MKRCGRLGQRRTPHLHDQVRTSAIGEFEYPVAPARRLEIIDHRVGAQCVQPLDLLRAARHGDRSGPERERILRIALALWGQTGRHWGSLETA